MTNIHVFKTPEESAKSLAAVFKDIFDNSKRTPFNIALSGGSTPKVLFKLLAEEYKTSIDWNKVHVYFVDERCVHPHHIESNYGMTKKNLLLKIEMPRENYHRMLGENNAETEAKRYSEELITNLKTNKGIPEFDFVLLGMGDDGHTASIFPNQMQLIQSENLCEVAVHPTTGQKRITLTPKIINNARFAAFMINGNGKSAMLERVIKQKDPILPASHIHLTHGDLSWYIDKEAAKLL